MPEPSQSTLLMPNCTCGPSQSVHIESTIPNPLAGRVRAQHDSGLDSIRSLRLFGPVSAEHWIGPQLPYVDNSVNLLVAETPGATSPTEMKRVLAPRGVAYVKQGNTWTKTVKPPRELLSDNTRSRCSLCSDP